MARSMYPRMIGYTEDIDAMTPTHWIVLIATMVALIALHTAYRATR